MKKFAATHAKDMFCSKRAISCNQPAFVPPYKATHRVLESIIPPKNLEVSPDCLSRVAAGDHKAFGSIYKNYSEKVFNYAMLLTADEHRSEDIVQDVFLKIWVKREQLKQIENFNDYLFIITRNITISIFRKKGREKYSQLEIDSYYLSPPLQQAIELKELRHVIAKLVCALPPQQKLVYQLKHQWGWKSVKIAKTLHVAPSTIKSHLKAGLRSVKKSVTQQYS